MSKKVFITGSAGFIGSHLARFLQNRGDEVIGYDNFNDYYSPKLKRMRAAELQRLGIEIIEGDINDAEKFELAVKSHHTTHLVHLAAQAGVRYSLTHPQSYSKANLDGFLNVLEICRKHPSMKLTYASSSSVYGANSKVPFSVEDRTDAPVSFYGVTKKANELMAQSYHRLFGLSVTGLRFFTVYGPWGRPDMAYYFFTERILNNHPIDIYHEGKMWRDFTYIDDIVAGTAAAIDLEAACEIFNLGNSQPVELLSMIDRLEELCGKKAIRNFLPMPSSDVLTTYADISYSQQKLGFVPSTSLQVGLERFVEWYLSQNSAVNTATAYS